MSNAQPLLGENLGKYFRGYPNQRDCLNYIVSCLSPDELAKATAIWRQPPPVEPIKDSYVYACWSGEYDPALHLRVFGMYLIQDGKVVDKIPFNSGLRDYQDEIVHPCNDFSGSCRPLPEGVYSIGPVNDIGYDPGSGDGFGRYFYPLNPQFKMGRSQFGVHCDRNRGTSPGSAGCPVTYTVQEMFKFVQWMNSKNPPNIFVMDHGLGFLKEQFPGTVIPIVKK